MNWYTDILRLKVTVKVMLRDPPCNEGNVRCATVPFKSLTERRGRRTQYVDF